jgi:hypothetical protein
MKLYGDWQKAMLGRFGDREDITKEGIYIHYFQALGLPEQCVFECLDLLESEYDVPAGLLRPDDKLLKLVQPVQARNPWRWLFYRSREEDIQSEINYQLAKRLRRHGTLGSWPRIVTIGDLVKAWCGCKPS